MRKLLSVVLVIGLLLGGFSIASAAEGKITLNFYAATDLDMTAQPIIDAFNASRDDVEVELILIPNDDYDDKMKVLTAGASDIDVFWIRTPAQAKMYIANNVLVDIKPYVEATGIDVTQIQASLDAVGSNDGSYFGLPTSGSCWMLFYNKTLFDAKGLAYPEYLSWDEYADLAKELTHEEGGKKYWGGLSPFWTPNLGAIPTGEYLDDETLDNTRAYMKVLHRLYVEDKSHPSIAEMSTGTFDVNAYFGAGNIYMMINGDWEYRLLDVDFEYGSAPLPYLTEDAKGKSAGQSSVLSIYKECAHPQEAFDFISFYTLSSTGTSIIAEKHDVPTFSTPEAMAVYQKEVTIPGVEYRFSSIILPEQASLDYYSELLQVFSEEMQLYLLAEQSLDEAFNNYIELRKEIMSE